jgi:hypothetical protein
MREVPIAPISSPVTSQTYQMWFENIGRHVNSATKIQTKSNNGNILNYNVNGATTNISYTGMGGFTAELPLKAKFRAIIPVTDNTNIIIEADSKTIQIPTYTKEVTIHGFYFNY